MGDGVKRNPPDHQLDTGPSLGVVDQEHPSSLTDHKVGSPDSLTSPGDKGYLLG